MKTKQFNPLILAPECPKKRGMCYRCGAKRFLKNFYWVNFSQNDADWHFVCKQKRICRLRREILKIKS